LIEVVGFGAATATDQSMRLIIGLKFTWFWSGSSGFSRSHAIIGRLRHIDRFITHVGNEMVFVADNISSPFMNVAISALPDFIRNLVDQSEVVRNKDHATIEALDSIGKGIDGFNIQVICRFVKKEEVALLI